MNLFFVVDEYTDVESAPVVREMVDIVIDALCNPHTPRPEGEIVLGRVAKEQVSLSSLFGCHGDRLGIDSGSVPSRQQHLAPKDILLRHLRIISNRSSSRQKTEIAERFAPSKSIFKPVVRI
jgi:hypothetical protein